MLLLTPCAVIIGWDVCLASSSLTISRSEIVDDMVLSFNLLGTVMKSETGLSVFDMEVDVSDIGRRCGLEFRDLFRGWDDGVEVVKGLVKEFVTVRSQDGLGIWEGGNWLGVDLAMKNRENTGIVAPKA